MATNSPALIAGPAGSAGMGRSLWIVAILALTALAGGAGAFWGLRVAGTVESAVMRRMDAAAPAPVASPALMGPMVLRKLAPVVTNLSSPANSWVRLEVSVMIDAKAAANADPVLAMISEDLLAYLRSVTARQLEGAAGLKNLREDVSERIAIRSKGLVRDIVIETLVVQ